MSYQATTTPYNYQLNTPFTQNNNTIAGAMGDNTPAPQYSIYIVLLIVLIIPIILIKRR